MIKKTEDGKIICENAKLFEHRLKTVEDGQKNIESEIKSLENATQQCLSMADKVASLAAIVKEAKSNKDIWIDRILWTIVLIIIMTVYNYIPKLLHVEQNNKTTITVEQLQDIIDNSKNNGR